MPQPIKFHLDENVSGAIATGLRRQGIDVATTPEQNLIGATDEEQIAFAQAQKRVIFTQDDDFLRLHRANVSHSGITYCHQGSRSIGEIIATLILIWEWIAPEDMVNRVEFL